MRRIVEVILLVLGLASLLCAETPRIHTVPADFAQSHLAQHVDPVLPAHAKVTQGKVTLHIVISAAGEVTSAKRVSGDRTLAAAAVKAVKQWKYRTFQENGVDIPVATDVNIDFPASH
jgi:TonB family protein